MDTASAGDGLRLEPDGRARSQSGAARRTVAQIDSTTQTGTARSAAAPIDGAAQTGTTRDGRAANVGAAGGDSAARLRSTAEGAVGIQRVCVLDVEPELCDGLDPGSLPAARRASAAATWSLPRGRWQCEAWMFDYRGSLGLLLLDGLIARHLRFGEMEAVELVGPGDVLRPWIAIDSDVSGHMSEHWMVTRRTHFAILDRSFALAVSPWPEIAANLSDRLAMRVGWIALSAAIQGMRRVDDRLLAILWSYADRWGRVTPEGVVLELELTHRLMAGVIGARRPSVTTALKSLEADGALLRRRDRTWLLRGDRPASLAADVPRQQHPSARRGPAPSGLMVAG